MQCISRKGATLFNKTTVTALIAYFVSVFSHKHASRVLFPPSSHLIIIKLACPLLPRPTSHIPYTTSPMLEDAKQKESRTCMGMLLCVCFCDGEKRL